MVMDISEKCQACIDALKKTRALTAEEVPLQERSVSDSIHNLLEKFGLWVGEVDALPRSASHEPLEDRLQERNDVLDHISGLLDDVYEAASSLRDDYQEGITDEIPDGDTSAKYASDEDDREALVREIASYVDRLFRTIKIIHDVAPSDPFFRATRHQELKIDERNDIAQVGIEFPSLARKDNSWLRLRLSRAIAHRQRLIDRYREQLNNRRFIGSEEDTDMASDDQKDQPIHLNNLPESHKDPGGAPTSFAESTPTDPSISSSTALKSGYSDYNVAVDAEQSHDQPRDELNNNDPYDRIPKLFDLQVIYQIRRMPFRYESSEGYIYGASDGSTQYQGPQDSDIRRAREILASYGMNPKTWGDDQLRILSKVKLTERIRCVRSYRSYLDRVRKMARNEAEFECPFCQENKIFNNEQAWRRHVYSDLRAYVCTFPECDKPYFDSADEWFDHEMQFHRVTFSCPICQEGSFDTSEQYLIHMKDRHPILLVDGSNEAILDIGKHPAQRILASDCPCCEDWGARLRGSSTSTDLSESVYASPSAFKTHLASHLERLSLLALPIQEDKSSTMFQAVKVAADLSEPSGPELDRPQHTDSRGMKEQHDKSLSHQRIGSIPDTRRISSPHHSIGSNIRHQESVGSRGVVALPRPDPKTDAWLRAQLQNIPNAMLSMDEDRKEAKGEEKQKHEDEK